MMNYVDIAVDDCGLRIDHLGLPEKGRCDVLAACTVFSLSPHASLTDLIVSSSGTATPHEQQLRDASQMKICWLLCLVWRTASRI
jgi:hypothetical protein